MHRQAVVSLQMRLPSVKPLLLVCAILLGGCTSPGPPAFRTGYVFPGSENVISLESFWFNVEGGGVSPVDKITPEYDPIGGYLFRNCSTCSEKYPNLRWIGCFAPLFTSNSVILPMYLSSYNMPVLLKQYSINPKKASLTYLIDIIDTKYHVFV